MTYQLIERYGEKRLYNDWCRYNGMYKASDALSEELGEYVSPNVVQYLSYKFGWKRVITDLSLPVALGILNGHVRPEYYKHIIISGLADKINMEVSKYENKI